MSHRSPFAKARAKRREMPMVELSLAAMVDMMINILIFLLHLYGRGAMVTQPSDDLQLAGSTATAPLALTVTIVVSRVSIAVDSTPVLDLVSGDGPSRLPDGVVDHGAIAGLTDAIARDLQQQRAGKPAQDTAPEVLVQMDKRTPWSVLGPVLRSASAAGVDNYRFIVSSETAERDAPDLRR